jgi:hypothetical protein
MARKRTFRQRRQLCTTAPNAIELLASAGMTQP